MKQKPVEFSARKSVIHTQKRSENMKLYTNVIARSQHRGSRLSQGAYAYSYTSVPRKTLISIRYDLE